MEPSPEAHVLLPLPVLHEEVKVSRVMTMIKLLHNNNYLGSCSAREPSLEARALLPLSVLEMNM